MNSGIVLGVAVLGGLILLMLIAQSILYVGGPQELLVFSGRNSSGGDNYTVVHNGWHLRLPGLEEVGRLDLTVMSVHIRIEGAYSEGGIPLNVHAIANVKVNSDPSRRRNAIERFLGQHRDEIRRVAKETLEGNVRSVVSEMTPEEVNRDRQRLAEKIAGQVKPDFEKLGLAIDTLKIQNVSDDRDYLDSIGRKRIAEILKVAEVAESNARKASEEAEAEARGRGEVARRKAQAQIQKAQNELRELKADLDRKAKSEEERAQARALEARAQAEQELQQVRTELEKIRLQADVVIPAEAEKVAQELKAQGEAAEIAEQGRAMARVLGMMAEVWHDAGDSAMDVFIIQRLESIMDKVAEAAKQVQIRKAALIDSGNGEALPNYVTSFPKIVGSLFDEMGETVGLDIGGALTGDHMDDIDPEERGQLEEAVRNELGEEGARLLDELAEQKASEQREAVEADRSGE
jgi:flotillin